MTVSRRRLRRLTGLWMSLGIPTVFLLLLFWRGDNWIDDHPFLASAAVVSLIGPLMIIGWLEYRARMLQKRE